MTITYVNEAIFKAEETINELRMQISIRDAEIERLRDTRTAKWKELLTRWTNDKMSNKEIDNLSRETAEFLKGPHAA